MRLNEDILIFTLEKGERKIRSVKGKTLDENFAVTKAYFSEEIHKTLYAITCIKCGMKLMNTEYIRIKDAIEDYEKNKEDWENTLKVNQKFLENKIKDFEETKVKCGYAPKPVKEELKEESKEYKDYMEYAKKVRSKSKLARLYDESMKSFGQVGKECLLNGGVMSDSAGKPYMYECTIGNGYEENNVRYTYSNMYTINFYSGMKGCTIYKSTKRSLHDKCFTCGETKEIFRDSGFREVRVYEDLEIDEVLMLCNKNWDQFYNVRNNRNKINLEFLRTMKQRLIRTLEYNKVIIYSNNHKKYIDYKLYEYDKKFYS